MKKSRLVRIPVLFLAAIMVFPAFASSAETFGNETEWIQPQAVARDGAGNPEGRYCIGVEDADHLDEGCFTLSLYLEDRYAREEIEQMKSGDRVTVHGETYTASVILIHGTIDTDGDGETDRSYVAVRDMDQCRDLLDAEELVADGDWADVPESFELSAYELIPAEEMFGYIVFEPVSEEFCRAVKDDWSPCTCVGSVTIRLPLPDGFVFEDAMGDEKGPEAFLDDLSETWYLPYNTEAWFADGRLMKVSHSDYPAGPDASLSHGSGGGILSGTGKPWRLATAFQSGLPGVSGSSRILQHHRQGSVISAVPKPSALTRRQASPAS